MVPMTGLTQSVLEEKQSREVWSRELNGRLRYTRMFSVYGKWNVECGYQDFQNQSANMKVNL